MRTTVSPFPRRVDGGPAASTHLGNPANALFVFLGVGRSPLSNEVFCAVVFLPLAGVYWLYRSPSVLVGSCSARGWRFPWRPASRSSPRWRSRTAPRPSCRGIPSTCRWPCGSTR
ncbi:MAG: DmsC/YnfH family molybdoenzyme membrane anchor subunit [Eggerthellaceae bacterium]